MKRNMQHAPRSTLFTLLIALTFLLALTGSIVVMARRAQAQEPGPQGPVLSEAEGRLIPQIALSATFTYQGRLIKDDDPISPVC